MKKALFPGSFDPFTLGHEAIVRRALALFDKIYIAVGVNTDKHYMFTPEQRLDRIRAFFPDDSRVEVVTYSDMTVDLCRRLGVQFILRGIRNAEDFAYEQTVAAVNHTLDPTIDTVILLSDTEHQDISSTLERERLAHQKS
ncbi:MAG: pantetheine-phosphate adenylyltransferase [Bacteroidales bacterium]|nr:pantetheine-phosphate adenylyltransferase [Bacteroidales bacterium]